MARPRSSRGGFKGWDSTAGGGGRDGGGDGRDRGEGGRDGGEGGRDRRAGGRDRGKGGRDRRAGGRDRGGGERDVLCNPPFRKTRAPPSMPAAGAPESRPRRPRGRQGRARPPETPAADTFCASPFPVLRGRTHRRRPFYVCFDD